MRTECAQIGHTLYKTLLCPRKVWRFLVWKQNCKKSIGFTLYHKRGGALPNLLFRLFYFMPDFCFTNTIAREVIFCNTNFRILLADNVRYRPIRILTHLKEEYNSQGAYSEKKSFRVMKFDVVTSYLRMDCCNLSRAMQKKSKFFQKFLPLGNFDLQSCFRLLLFCVSSVFAFDHRTKLFNLFT